MLKKRIAELEKIVGFFILPDKYLFQRDVSFTKNVVFSTNIGTIFGTTTTQKLAFFAKTPIVQQAAITAPAGGATTDAEARTAINTIITRLEDFGFVAAN